MSTACSLEPARVSVADLEAVPEVEPEAKLKAPARLAQQLEQLKVGTRARSPGRQQDDSALDKVVEATRYVETGRRTGNVVLRVSLSAGG